MAETTWTNPEAALLRPRTNRLKYIIGGVVILAALAYLVVNAARGNTQLFITVEEFYSRQSQLAGRDLKVAGVVVGDSIQYTQIDPTTSRLEFDIVDNLTNPRYTLHIVAMNEPKPDLLQHEAQALVEGRAAADGTFQANPGGLFLKCPTRYEEMEPATTAN
jgi:cytochrome c-type biogenesis protein CcmE